MNSEAFTIWPFTEKNKNKNVLNLKLGKKKELF